MTLMERVSPNPVETESTSRATKAALSAPKYFPGERSSALRSLAKTWYLATMAQQLQTPTPRDKPEYRSRMSTSFKVLLVGNGPTHGWGVVTHGLALTGQLGGMLGRRCGYGVDVDYVGEELLNAASTLDFLDKRNIAAYDLVVLVLSLNDALRLTPMEEWERDVNNTLDYLRAQRRPGVQIQVVGIGSADTAVGYGNPMGAIAQRHAERLNLRMEETVHTRGDHFSRLSPPHIELGKGARSKETYSIWADEIASQLVTLLPKEIPSKEKLPEEVWERPGLKKVMAYDGPAKNEKLNDIVDRAKKALLAPIVYISVVDHETQYMPTAVGSMAAALPIDLSYCKYTVRDDETVTVDNAMTDERFEGNAYVDAVHLPSYKGRPLHAENGDVIGTFCIMGPVPKFHKLASEEKFNAFADEAEQALREIEASQD